MNGVNARFVLFAVLLGMLFLYGCGQAVEVPDELTVNEDISSESTDPTSPVEEPTATESSTPTVTPDVTQTLPDSSRCGEGELKRDHYVVNYCENLTRIANKLGVTLSELIAANPQIEDPNLIFPAQWLNLPESITGR